MIISLLVIIGIFSKIFFTSNTSFKTSSKEIFIPSVDTKNSAYDSIIFLVDNLNFFRKAAELKKFNPSPGRYILKKGMSNNEIINNHRLKNRRFLDNTSDHKSKIPRLFGQLCLVITTSTNY